MLDSHMSTKTKIEEIRSAQELRRINSTYKKLTNFQKYFLISPGIIPRRLRRKNDIVSVCRKASTYAKHTVYR